MRCRTVAETNSLKITTTRMEASITATTCHLNWLIEVKIGPRRGGGPFRDWGRRTERSSSAQRLDDLFGHLLGVAERPFGFYQM